MTIDPKFSEWRTNGDISIDLRPVRKFNWKTGGARDYWEPEIGRFREDVVVQYVTEAIADEDHPQDAAVVRFGEDMVMELASLFGTKGVVFSQLSVHGDNGGSLFTAYPNTIDVGGEQKDDFILAKDEETMKRVSPLITSTSFTEEEYREAAEIFGWPDCCIDFHVEHALEHMFDPLYEIACNTESAEPYEDDREQAHLHFPDPMLNIAWRYMGWSLIQHLPCSFECEHSSEIARKNYDVLVENDLENEAEHVLSWLDLPLTWSGFHGLVNIRNAYGIGSYTTNNYWNEKQIIWQRPHQKKPNFEPNHNTTALEPLDPEASQI